MPLYNDLRPDKEQNEIDYELIFPKLEDTDRRRILKNLLHLRAGLKNDIPVKKAEQSLLLATWNIKELGHLKERLPESFFYMAEIISKFDLIAIQEIKSSLNGLNKIMRLLGPDWGYIITDITEGRAGNSERFGYIYNKKKVVPSGLSGEIVLWDDLVKDSTISQLKRTPAITGFTAGWKSFAIINVHLHPGNKPDDEALRKEEVRLLLNAIKEKDKENHFWSKNLIMLGDTNIYKKNISTISLFGNLGFKESEELEGKVTNVSKSEIYDRIFLRVHDSFFVSKEEDTEKGGVFQTFDYVFNEATRTDYHEIMKEHKDNPSNLTSDTKFKSYYNRYWKRNQLSDHNPVWIEIEIDSSDLFLSNKLEDLS